MILPPKLLHGGARLDRVDAFQSEQQIVFRDWKLDGYGFEVVSFP